MIPKIGLTLDLPQALDGMPTRHHNKAVKDAVRTCLVTHHGKRIPLHFQASNRGKYQHKERRPRYKARKLRRYGSRTDLVASGRTRTTFRTIGMLRVGGSASGGGTANSAPGVRGTLTYRFPFPASFERSTNKVTLQQMALEISRWTDQEAAEAAKQLQEQYAKNINDILAASPRLRMRVLGA